MTADDRSSFDSALRQAQGERTSGASQSESGAGGAPPSQPSPLKGEGVLGTVVGGSLTDGVEVRLAEGASVEDIPVGSYVVIQGETRRFFGMVSEVRLAATDSRLRSAPGSFDDPFVAQALTGTAAYGSIVVRPRLTLPSVAGAPVDIAPARTVPAHFSRAHRASPADVAQVFGEEGGAHFAVGTPLDMEAAVCLDLRTLLQRSNGVFGKSGTGKSFLTRLLLVGVLQSRLSSLLIFDMHNEYGWEGGDVERGRRVKSLKQLFPSEVAVFALDEERARGAKVQPDFTVEIGYGEITPDDIMALRETLDISEAAAEAAFALGRRFGDGRWLREFLRLEGSDEIGELAVNINVNGAALATLHRRLTNRVTRLPFVTDAPGADAVAAIMDHLDRGKHVVLEFGRHGDDVIAYMLVANLLTRRIHDRYRERQTAAVEGRATTPLTIVIEEAHRFLSPAVAAQSPFGVIAREMRKNNVTLLVVDQRPSAIDPEVLSQVGTKVCCLLDDERDVDAVMAGASGSRELRSVLAGLRSRQQALFFGEAVPIPVAVQVREYGTDTSYSALMGRKPRRERRETTPASATASANGAQDAPSVEDDEDDDPLFG